MKRKHPNLCLFFEVHQPFRLVEYDFFRIGEHAEYFDHWLNTEILERVYSKSYLPAGELFLELIRQSKGEFKLSLSLSGVLIEQFEKYMPEQIDLFKELIQTGSVEVLAETYYHSLASVYSDDEFRRQVEKHSNKIESTFGVRPHVFRNTELVYSNHISGLVEEMGYQGILAEGLDSALGGRSPNYLYHAPGANSIQTLLRNVGLSDDIGSRFSAQDWSEYPLTATKYLEWLKNSEGDLINLFMDLETIGEHHPQSSGIFDFWRYFVKEALASDFTFATPSELLADHKSVGIYDCEEHSSWAAFGQDLSPWLGNVMQVEAQGKIHRLESLIKEVKDPELTHSWALLQTNDHFHYMATQPGVFNHFSPYENAYDSYIYFMNALADIQIRLKRALEKI